MHLSRALTAFVLLATSACVLGKTQSRSVACDKASAFFAEEIEPKILLASCATCHAQDGLAQRTRFVVDTNGTPQATEHNLATVALLSRESVKDTPLLLAKPSGVTSHGGGTPLAAGGALYAKWQAAIMNAALCTQTIAPEAIAAAQETIATAAPPGTPPALAPPAPPIPIAPRLRRLTTAELDATYAALVPGAPSFAAKLPIDTRQAGYTQNADQRVEELFAKTLDDAAIVLATMIAGPLKQALAPCPTGRAEAACAGDFIASFGKRAFRRPVADDHAAQLAQVYAVGIDGGTHADGIALVARAILQSPELVYVTELGAGGADTTLDAYEAASVLAYSLTGAPPDAALMARADAGGLLSAEERKTEARRLLATAPGRAQMRKMLAEWLTTDRATENVTDAMLAETNAFIDAAVEQNGASLSALLTTGTAPRVGLLTQASFLAAFAHGDDSAPVKRGVVIRKRFLCQELSVPPALQGQVQVPQPQANQTTRERFAAHSTNATCAGCHSLIDPLGFAFEAFDGKGRYRTSEKGKPIDSSGTLVGTGDADAPFADAAELAKTLAASAAVRACFAKNMHRFYSAQSLPGTETFFLQGFDAAADASLTDLILRWAASDAFFVRRAEEM